MNRVVAVEGDYRADVGVGVENAEDAVWSKETPTTKGSKSRSSMTAVQLVVHVQVVPVSVKPGTNLVQIHHRNLSPGNKNHHDSPLKYTRAAAKTKELTVNKGNTNKLSSLSGR